MCIQNVKQRHKNNKEIGGHKLYNYLKTILIEDSYIVITKAVRQQQYMNIPETSAKAITIAGIYKVKVVILL